MPVTVVIGAQWGDEGKGKITDLLAQESDVCVRFSGGDNAGHTVINDQGEFKLHLIPCGIFNPETLCVIGNGVAINPSVLMDEMLALERRGVSCKNLRISMKAHLIMPWHLILDGLQEEERGQGKIGTTRRGIGPVFSDKIARFGFRVEDLFADNMDQKLKSLWRRSVKILSQVYHPPDVGDVMLTLENLAKFKERIASLAVQTEPILWETCDQGKRILMEGAQGTMLDPDFGAYPNTTSSPCTLAGALQGSGISWKEVKEVIGVVKAYTTRSCEKNLPFSAEMDEETANILREQAGEYGVTTGRARRMGWLCIPDVRYAARLNGFTSLAVTRMDNIGALPLLKVCHEFDASGAPVYLEMPGAWGADIMHDNAVGYLKAIENLVRVPIRYVSYGPERNQVIERKLHSL